MKNEKVMNILGRVAYTLLGLTAGMLIATEYFINLMS